jgi:hypothetical protein
MMGIVALKRSLESWYYVDAEMVAQVEYTVEMSLLM